MRQKYFFTPAQDKVLLNRYDSKKETVNALAAAFGFPTWTIRKRAAILGVSRTKEPRWSEADEDYLRKHYSTKSLRTLSKELNRTITSIMLKKKRLGIRKTDDGYTLRGLCEALGVDHHKVEYWVAQGWLKKRGRGIQREEHDYWLVTDKNLRDFVRAHPEEIDLRRVDKFWFIDLLAGVKTKVPDFEGVPGEVEAVGALVRA